MALANSKKKVFDGRYEILSIVGRGSRSVVYHARLFSDPSSEVALKVLIDQQDRSANSERLRKEALAMITCRHRYVIRLDDFHSFQDLCYLSMEFAPESDLRRYTAKIGGFLSVAQAERFLLQATRALSFIHQTGTLHRDIKPDNILVLNDREIRLGDFGVAVLPGEKQSTSELERGVGTMSYMAPEVLEGKNYTAQSDLYALGVTIYELLTGAHPFDHIPLARQLEARQTFRIDPLVVKNQGLPSYLVDAIEGLMSYDLDSRFKSAQELIEALSNKENEDSGRSSVKKTYRANQVGQAPQISQKIENEEPLKHSNWNEAPKTTPAQSQPTYAADESNSNNKRALKNVVSADTEPKSSYQTEVSKNYDLAPQKEPPARFHDQEQPDFSDLDKTPQLTEEVRGKMSSKKRKEKSTRVRSVSESPSLAQGLFAHRNRKKLLGLAFLGLLALIFVSLNFSFTNSKAAKVEKKVPGTLQSASAAQVGSYLIPTFGGGALSFPYLPPGLYNGTISDLIPGQTAPLVMISFEDRLVVIIGMEGWTPEVIRREDLVQSAISPGESHLPLRVRSNGFVLNLTGREIEGQLIGFFRNVATNETGEWELKPQA